MRITHCCLLAWMLLALCQNTIANAEELKEQQIVEKWLGQLTLEEKAGQLNLIPISEEPTPQELQLIRDGKVGSVIKANGAAFNLRLQKIAVEESRAGVPLLFQEDVIHGYKTIAPIPIAEAASWDLDAIRNSAAVAAREAKAAGIQLTYAPMIDVGRDPRWGRILEGAGEDPYLGALIAKARVQGFQESGRTPNENILSTAKHFIGYGAALAGRDYHSQEFNERELREIHLPPFKSAIDAGVSSVMGSYSSFDGVAATGSDWLMQTLLRDELGFNGLLMTDWDTINMLKRMGLAANDEEAVTQAMIAGYDMDMKSGRYVDILPKLVRKGLISETAVDNAVRQVLSLKLKAGLLEAPYNHFNSEKEKAELLSKENWQTVKDVTRKSMVLLKNENGALPISKDTKRIAIIGPLAKAQKDLLGWWSMKGDPNDVVSIFDGLEQRFSSVAEIRYAEGVRVDKFELAGAELIPEALSIAQKADVVIAVVGEREWMSGEGGSVASLRLPGLQEQLIEKLASTDTPVITVVVTGRPYVLTNIAKHSDAILLAWMPGTTGGEAVAELISGDVSPVGRLPMTFPYHEGQVPIFYNYKPTSHGFNAGDNNNRYTSTYRDVQSKPLYPFGYGLAYTTFEYGVPSISRKTMKQGEPLTVKVKVTNIGERWGRETVQLYIRDKVAQVLRPLKELKDFKLLELQAGQSEWIKFQISDGQLSYLGRDLMPRIDKGKFIAYVGPNSEDVQAVEFNLE